MIEIPIAWMLSTILGLGGVIATLAGIIFRILMSRLAAQDKIIEHLQADVARLSKGCGEDNCRWRHR